MKKILSVLLVAVMVLAVVPFTASAAVEWTTLASTDNAHTNIDHIWGASSDDILAEIKGLSTASVSITKGSKTHVTFFGWFAIDTQDIAAYGYSINGASIVYDASFKGVTLGEAVGQKYSYRYYTKVPVSGLSEGTHTIKNVAKLADGTEVYIGTLTLTITATTVAGETVPGLYTGDLSIMNMDFQNDTFTNGFDIMTSGNPFRSNWTPFTAGGNASAIVVEGTNKYLKLDGFFEATPDYRWNAPYEFSVDVKGYADNAAGIFINNANDCSTANSVEMDTHFPLYEGCMSGTNAYSGHTGIFLRFASATTMEIVVYTFDEANTYWDSYCGKISTTVTVPSLNSFQTVNVKDDNQGKIIIAVAGNVVATIKYSNDGVYNNFSCADWGDFSERYYKTATIYDAAGVAVATTDSALISYYKRVGFGVRAVPFSIDNIVLSAYTAPSTSLSVSIPTDIVAAPGASISVPVVLTGDAEIVYVNGSVKYDSALTYTGYSIGNVFTAFDSSSKIVNNSGEVDFVLMDSALTDRVANGTLIKLKFTVPTDAANGTVYTFEYVPSTIDDAFCDFDETEYLPVSNTAGKATVVAEEVEAPEAIEVVSGSDHKVIEDYTSIVVKMSTKSGEVVSDFMAEVATDAEFVRVVNASGTVLTETGKVTTGCAVQLLDADGNVAKSYAVVLAGDCDNNGRMSAKDVVALKSVMSNKPSKGTMEFFRADIDYNNRLSAQDTLKLQSFMSNVAW